MIEDKIQSQAFAWFHNNYCLKHHNPRYVIFSCPNGGMRNRFEAARFKASGVLSGVSDLIVLLDSKTLFIELKNGSSGRQSKSQIEFQERVMNLGFKYYLCRSEEDFWGAINSEI